MALHLGNVAMASASDVADALRKVALRLENGDTASAILDANGNTVGGWFLAEDDDDTETEDDGQGDDVWADANALASAGHGTDEDYGFYGNDDY
jgi:hypothetical protein